jgi:hypothetical protein
VSAAFLKIFLSQVGKFGFWDARPLPKIFRQMDVITIESQAYRELVTKINTISKFVLAYEERAAEKPTEGWVDSYEVCTFLKMSSRTLQRLRTSGAVSYSKIRGKNFYKLSEVRRMLDERIIRSTDECFQDLIKNHRLHAQQRRDTRANR